jgi:hypothetical protein
MMMHPEVLLSLTNDRHRELMAEADRGRLLNGARTARSARRARKAPVVRAQSTGTLAACEPSAVVPAR